MASKKVGTGGFKRYMEYDGKRYEFRITRRDKAAADKIADNYRKKGLLAKVQPYFSNLPPYAVYARKNQ